MTAPTVAWVRRHPDGALTNEILLEIEQVRRDSGAWLPLVVATPTPPAESDPMAAAIDALVDHDAARRRVLLEEGLALVPVLVSALNACRLVMKDKESRDYLGDLVAQGQQLVRQAKGGAA